MSTSNDVPLTIMPGVLRGPTQAAAPNAWWEVNLIRWVNGVMRPHGGIERLSLSGATITGSIRAVTRWIDVAGIPRIAVLTESNIYYIEAGTVTDISPASALVTPTTVGGYGDGLYSAETYGTARSSGSSHITTVSPWFSIGVWGQTVLFMSSWDGRLLQWDPTWAPGTKATAVTGAPTGNRGFVVTEQKFVMLFAAGGVPNRFSWCSQDDILDWNYASVSNSAGFYDIEPAGFMQGAVATKSGVTFATTRGTFFAQFTGLPNVYSYNLLAVSVVPTTSACMVEVMGGVIFYSDGAFWQTDGNTLTPVDCNLLEWLLDNINHPLEHDRMWGMNYGTYSEVYWFFPSTTNNVDTECDRYIGYNYKDRIWGMGKLRRSAGFPATAVDSPLLCSPTDIYSHESGDTFTDVTELPYAISTRLAFGQRDLVTTINKLIIDQGAGEALNQVSYTMSGRFNRNAVTPEVTKPGTLRADGKVDVRITARDHYLTIQQTDASAGDWTFGGVSVSWTNRGRR